MTKLFILQEVQFQYRMCVAVADDLVMREVGWMLFECCDLWWRPLSPKSATESVLESAAPELGVVGRRPGEPGTGGQLGQEVEVSQAGGPGAVNLHTPRLGHGDLREEEDQRVWGTIKEFETTFFKLYFWPAFATKQVLPCVILNWSI